VRIKRFARAWEERVDAGGLLRAGGDVGVCIVGAGAGREAPAAKVARAAGASQGGAAIEFVVSLYTHYKRQH